MRTGRSISGEYTSRIPPRIVTCPGISTTSTRVYPTRQQMLHQHLRHMLFALAQLQRQRRIIIARKQLHARCFHWRNHQPPRFPSPASKAPPLAAPESPDAAKDFQTAAHHAPAAAALHRALNAPVSSHAASTAVCRASAALLSETITSAGACAARTKYGRYSARAVAVSPDTRLRPVPPAKCRRTRSNAAEDSRSAINSRTKGKIMLSPVYQPSAPSALLRLTLSALLLPRSCRRSPAHTPAPSP